MSTGNSDVMKGRYTKFIYEMIDIVNDNRESKHWFKLASTGEHNSKILKEFFTVGYVGTRQTGKTYSAIEFLLENEGYILLSPYTSMMGHYPKIAHELGGEEAVMELGKRTYLYNHILRTEFDPTITDVKGVIIDEAGMAFNMVSPGKYYQWLYRSLNGDATKLEEAVFVPTILVY